MPRIVDHNQRRDELARAAMRIILREGLDGVTVRGVAAEAEVSTGSLRHYFANQRELQEYVIAATAAHLREVVTPRIDQRRPGLSPLEAVAEAVEQLLPLDAQRQEEYALWAAVAAWERRAAPPDGSRTWADQRSLHRQCIAALRGRPLAPSPEAAAAPHADPAVEVWAALLHTFTDGLASQLINTPGEVSPDAARHLLRSLLSAVPGPESGE
ncbi:AcrR family transcriptional regulator [Brevibacterium pityocampae]